jgi:hypothetical protein
MTNKIKILKKIIIFNLYYNIIKNYKNKEIIYYMILEIVISKLYNLKHK